LRFNIAYQPSIRLEGIRKKKKKKKRKGREKQNKKEQPVGCEFFLSSRLGRVKIP
jgi:hypothetical protein